MKEGTYTPPSYFSRSVKTASTSGWRARKSTSRWVLSGFQASSESRNDTSSPLASATPALRVADTPAWGRRT
jgi:hypothetical protein